MKLFSTTKFILCFSFLLSLFGSIKSSAESYVGVQGGVSLGNMLKDNRSDVNVNTPFGPAKFNGTKLTDLDLDESFSVGAKVGHYFDAIPFLGVEGEVNYTKPDFLRQNLTVSNPNLGPFNGSTILQNGADIHDFSAGASLMARYPAFKRVMPYVGVGPMLHYYRVRGGAQAPQTLAPFVTVPGPSINQDELAIGLQAKAGVRLAATKRLAVDVEYKFNYSPARLDQFRNLDNFRGTYNSHQIGLALVYRFGNIKW